MEFYRKNDGRPSRNSPDSGILHARQSPSPEADAEKEEVSPQAPCASRQESDAEFCRRQNGKDAANRIQNSPLLRRVRARSTFSPGSPAYNPANLKEPGRSSTGGATGSGHPIFHKKERCPEIFRRSFQSKSLKTIQQTFQSPSVETATALTHSQGAGSKIRSTTLRARKRNP